MDTIGKTDLWTFEDSGDHAVVSGCKSVRCSTGHFVANYLELAAKIAELQFRNRDYVLFFRGQRQDWRAKGQSHVGSTLRPTIFRPPNPKDDRFWLSARFSRLKEIEAGLVRQFQSIDVVGSDEIERYRILRWVYDPALRDL